MELKDNKIIASKNTTLFCTINDINYGKEVDTGLIFYDKNGIKLEKPHRLALSDFIEIPDEIPPTVTIDGFEYNFKGKTYAEIKTFIIKLHYSNDDQIAIMLNKDMNEEAAEKYEKMQEWREFASEVAGKYGI